MSSQLERREKRLKPAAKTAGWCMLVPGCSQWIWGQRERGAVLFGTFAGSLAVGLFAWGSRAGWAMLTLAFLVHVMSAADAIKQAAFPGFGRWVPPITASLTLGLGCYAPAFAMGAVLAWPDVPSGTASEGYLINLWAYRDAEPSPGDWVWYRAPNGGALRLGRLVAGGGRSVEWSGNDLRVGGEHLEWLPHAPDGKPVSLSMTVPDDQILVAPSRAPAEESASLGLVLVPRSQLIGRPWARTYPIWSRRLL